MRVWHTAKSKESTWLRSNLLMKCFLKKIFLTVFCLCQFVYERDSSIVMEGWFSQVFVESFTLLFINNCGMTATRRILRYQQWERWQTYGRFFFFWRRLFTKVLMWLGHHDINYIFNDFHKCSSNYSLSLLFIIRAWQRRHVF